MSIVIIEDESRLASSLKEGLQDEGYRVNIFLDAESAEKALIEEGLSASLIILDLMLPKKSGFEFCRDLRAKNIPTPILALTALDTVEDKVTVLDLGADDFMTKPFSFEELAARVRTLRRRPVILQSSVLSVHDLTLDPGARTVHRDGKAVELTSTEFELLHYLMQRKGMVVTRKELLANIWDAEESEVGNVVDVHIWSLRDKIHDAHDKKIIRSIRGSGYSVQD